MRNTNGSENVRPAAYVGILDVFYDVEMRKCDACGVCANMRFWKDL